MKLAIAAAAAAVGVAQSPQRDFVAFVTNTIATNGAGGQLGYYFGGNAVYRVVSCSDQLIDITSVNNDTLVFSSTTQIYVRAVNDTSSTCGRAVLSSALTGGRIAHIATDGTWIYFTVRDRGWGGGSVIHSCYHKASHRIGAGRHRQVGAPRGVHGRHVQRHRGQHG